MYLNCNDGMNTQSLTWRRTASTAAVSAPGPDTGIVTHHSSAMTDENFDSRNSSTETAGERPSLGSGPGAGARACCASTRRAQTYIYRNLQRPMLICNL